MDASIKESVKASDKEAQYDEKAKKLLGHKIILAYILVNTVDEKRKKEFIPDAAWECI